MMNKILIVEDEFSISNFMKTVLEGDGYTVEVATCAAQARAALEKMEFSAMLLDLGLPDADGLELLSATAEMTDHHPETPVITMSMGPLGAVSRLCGEAFGSAMTFANPGTASAPGQVGLDVVNAVLDSLRLS